MHIRFGGRRFSLIFNTFVIKIPIPTLKRFKSGLLSNKIEYEAYNKATQSIFLGRVYGSYLFHLFLVMERYFNVGEYEKIKLALNYNTVFKKFEKIDSIRKLGLSKSGYIFIFDYGDTSKIRRGKHHSLYRYIIQLLNLTDNVITEAWNEDNFNKRKQGLGKTLQST